MKSVAGKHSSLLYCNIIDENMEIKLTPERRTILNR